MNYFVKCDLVLPHESTNLRTIQTAHPLMENASHFVYQLNCHMINANEGYLPL